MLSLLVFIAVASVVFAWREYRRAQASSRELADLRDEQSLLAETTGEQAARADALTELNAALNEEVETHRRAAARLRLSEERYALAARGANDGLWDWNLATGAMYYSERWCEMVGEMSRPLAANAEEWFSRVHLSDLPQLKVDIAAQAAGARSHFLSEHRLRHADGYFIWVLCRGIVVRDTEGRALRGRISKNGSVAKRSSTRSPRCRTAATPPISSVAPSPAPNAARISSSRSSFSTATASRWSTTRWVITPAMRCSG
jgi:PAS domain-containing protein